MPAEFAAFLQNTKPGKAPRPRPQLIILAGAALMSWLLGFLSSCLHHLRIPKPGEKLLQPRSQSPQNPERTQRAIIRSLCFAYSSTPVSNPLSIHCFPLSRLNFGVRDQRWIKQFCSPKTLRTVLKQKKRPVPCLYIWQWLVTLSGTVPHLQTTQDSYLKNTW